MADKGGKVAASPTNDGATKSTTTPPATTREPNRALELQSVLGNRTTAGLLGAADGLVDSPAIVKSVVRSPGAPIASDARRRAEASLGAPLDHVIVHRGGAASLAADAVGAKAFTVGHHVVLGHERGSTPLGRREALLTHELTHAAQGPSTATTPNLEAQATRAELGLRPSLARRSTGRARLLMSPERATRLVAELRGEHAEFTLFRDEGPPLTATGRAEGLDAGTYRIVMEADRGALTITQADGTDLPTSSAFNIHIPETARRMHRLLQRVRRPIPFEVRASARTGTGRGGGGSSLADQIRDLPERIRQFIFSGFERTIDPRDYEAVLRIAAKLSPLTDAELAAYQSQVTSGTTNIRAFEDAIDRYIASLEARRAAIAERERVKLRLYGLDEIYQRYRTLQQLRSNSRNAAPFVMQGGVGTSIGTTLFGSQPLERELDAALRARGFENGLPEFEELIHQFERAFRDEAVQIGLELLGRYEHVLYEQSERYRDTDQTNALHGRLAPARAGFERAIAIRAQHASSVSLSMEDMAAQSYHSARFRAEQSAAAGEVAALAPDHPLLGNRDIPHESLARASQQQLPIRLQRYIEARRDDIRTTRANLQSSPDLIFELDALKRVAYGEMRIEPGSLYDQIIRDHTRERAIDHAVVSAAIAVFAIAAGLVSGGTGTVAVLGAASAFGIGAYQAYEEFRRYETLSAASGAQLLSEDPSIVWVVIAVAGAGLDLAAMGATLRAIRPAAQAFNETHDIVELERRLARLTDIEEGVRENVVRAARAQEEMRTAWGNVVRTGHVLYSFPTPYVEMAGRLVYAVYLTARRGLISLERGALELETFLMRREAIQLFGDPSQLESATVSTLRTYYGQAIGELQTITGHARTLGMADNEINAFLHLRSENPTMTVEDLTRQMDEWNQVRQSGTPFGFDDASQFADFQEVAARELRRATRRLPGDSEAFLQGSSVSGVRFESQLPFGASSDFDVAVVSPSLFEQARRAGLPVQSNPLRIGPLVTAEDVELVGLTRLRTRLGRAAARVDTEGTERTVNFMLFRDERAMTTPIGGAEATRPTRPLRPPPEGG